MKQDNCSYSTECIKYFLRIRYITTVTHTERKREIGIIILHISLAYNTVSLHDDLQSENHRVHICAVEGVGDLLKFL